MTVSLKKLEEKEKLQEKIEHERKQLEQEIMGNTMVSLFFFFFSIHLVYI